jgi:poly(A) polymerase
VKSFVAEVCRTSHDPNLANSVSGLLVAFGSHRLDVANADSDIDVVCVVPHFVRRTDFFTVFHRILLNHSPVRDLVKIEDASVPIMTMKFSGVDIDISFAQLAVPSVEDFGILESDTTLADVDQATVRSLNGYRVSNLILKLVPDVHTFREFLRFIRYWAHSRGIYGNVYGYLGGVNCALLCAFICQRYPKATVATLVLMFFHELMDWPWPAPIQINTPTTGTRPSWDNTAGSAGRRDLMPIITPAYPAQNSLRSASKSTKARMTQEFKRGFTLAKKSITEGEPWANLVKPSTFFNTYRKYVQVLVWAASRDDYQKWIGTVESRIRAFAQQIEVVRFMTGAVPWPGHFDGADEEGHEWAGSFFIGVDYLIPPEESVDRRIDISDPCQRFIDSMYADKQRTENMHMFVKLLARGSMPDCVFPAGRPPRKTGRV